MNSPFVSDLNLSSISIYLCVCVYLLNKKRPSRVPLSLLLDANVFSTKNKKNNMGKPFRKYIVADVLYTCTHCKAHLATHGDVVSKAFMGRNGRAYLFRSVVNINLGEQEDRFDLYYLKHVFIYCRILSTGLHTVSDVFCNVCDCKVF